MFEHPTGWLKLELAIVECKPTYIVDITMCPIQRMDRTRSCYEHNLQFEYSIRGWKIEYYEKFYFPPHRKNNYKSKSCCRLFCNVRKAHCSGRKQEEMFSINTLNKRHMFQGEK